MIFFLQGDLLANEHNALALGHGVNCQGVMGAGIAKKLRDKYPLMYKAYRHRCLKNPRGLVLGEVFLWRQDKEPLICNMATQERVGYGVQAVPSAIKTALRGTRDILDAALIKSLAIPHIGCGLGGLNWKTVQPLVVDAFDSWSGTLYVFDYA